MLSTYEQGHQPLAVASLTASLAEAGHRVRSHDLAVDAFDPRWLIAADVVFISVPMHTAARLGLDLARRLQAIEAPPAVVFFGSYAPALRGLTEHEALADVLVSGESEALILDWLSSNAGCLRSADRHLPLVLSGFARQEYPVPDRSGLPGLDRYSHVLTTDGPKVAGYSEASRGCAHSCTHCPLTPVYAGRLRLVQEDVVLADIANQVALGAEHITFGDPDFLNAPRHSLQICEELHRRFPHVTFDLTAKVEHLIEYAAALSDLQRLGCLFITSAFESTSDEILGHLAKGHRRADLEKVLRLGNGLGLPIRPTWMAFTPWTAAQDFLEMLEFVRAHELIECVQPIQYGLRLLIPPGSPLIEEVERDGLLREFDPEHLGYRWVNPDPRLDELQSRLESALARPLEHECGPSGGDQVAFEQVCWEAHRLLGGPPPTPLGAGRPRFVPGLAEDWFC